MLRSIQLTKIKYYSLTTSQHYILNLYNMACMLECCMCTCKICAETDRGYNVDK